MSNGTDVEELSRQANFIFRGTAIERGAATEPSVPVDNRTLIVTVNEILKAPSLLQNYAGENITVQLGEGQSIRIGQERIFYTQSWIFGESIAVVALGHTAAGARASATAVAMVEAEPASALRERVDSAEVVVAGRVVEITEPTSSGTTRITEHDPVWQEAVVEVDDVAKGSLADDQKKQIVVRFARSEDARWYQAPKFEVGQEGVWLLGDSRATAARAALGEEPGKYLAIDAADFLPKEQIEEVRSVINGGSS
jgi:hypothetical protein